jgi:Family of unknown function (DUF6325)
MSVGAVEYMVLSYGENGLGAAADEMAKLVNDGTVRLLDLAVIEKDEDGSIELLDYDAADGLAGFAAVDGVVGGLISQADADYAGEALEPGASAMLVLWEDPWAQPFFDALQTSGVELVEGGRVPDDIAVSIAAVVSAD